MQKQLFTSDKTNWETPGSLFNLLNETFVFDLDAAADHYNRTCSRYIAPDYGEYGENVDCLAIDALDTDWSQYGQCVYLNPPYGSMLKPFMKKVVEQSKKVYTIVCLTPARTDTVWFRDIWTHARHLVFIYGRLKFTLDRKEITSATFPSVISVFSKQNWELDHLSTLGKVITLNN